jgi:hypothetical protein
MNYMACKCDSALSYSCLVVIAWRYSDLSTKTVYLLKNNHADVYCGSKPPHISSSAEKHVVYMAWRTISLLTPW